MSAQTALKGVVVVEAEEGVVVTLKCLVVIEVGTVDRAEEVEHFL